MRAPASLAIWDTCVIGRLAVKEVCVDTDLAPVRKAFFRRLRGGFSEQGESAYLTCPSLFLVTDRRDVLLVGPPVVGTMPGALYYSSTRELFAMSNFVLVCSKKMLF